MHLIINTSKQFHNELSLPRSMYDLFACDNKYLVMTLTLFVSQEVQDLSAELGELSISLCNNPTDQKLTVKINCARALQQITKDGKLSMCFLYEEVFEANSREVDLSSFFLFCFTGVKTDQLFIFSAISGKRIRLYVLLDCFVDYKDKRSYWTIKVLTLICDSFEATGEYYNPPTPPPPYIYIWRYSIAFIPRYQFVTFPQQFACTH